MKALLTLILTLILTECSMLKRGPGELAQHKLSLLHQHHAMLPSLLILICSNLQISEKDKEQLNVCL